MQNDNTPQNDPAWLDGLSNTASTAIADMITKSLSKSSLGFVVSTVSSAGTTLLATEAKVDIEYFEDSSEIKIGDKLYPADVAVDATLSVVLTDLAVAAVSAISGVTIAPAGIVGLLIAGGVGYAYSKFIDPITEDVLKTLDGKDMVQFFSNDGDVKAGLIFPDGIPGKAQNGIQTFIAHPASAQLDLTSGYLQLDADVFIDDYYKIIDGAAFQAIADRIGVPLSDFLTTSSGDYANDEYYATAADGKTYAFYARSTSALDQKLAIKVVATGALQTIGVNTVYHDGTLLWGDALNGHTGPNLAMTADNGGYVRGIPFIDDLILGSDAADTIETGSTLLAKEDRDTVLAGDGDDKITGGYSNDLIDGGSGHDLIDGGAGDDTLLGGVGDDTFIASTGNDLIDGGDGVDTLDYSVLDEFLDNDVKVYLHENTATISYLFNADDTQKVFNVENVKTGSGDDVITGDDRPNVLEGGAGNDSLYGGVGNDRYVFTPNHGNDVIRDTDHLGIIEREGQDVSGNMIPVSNKPGYYTLDVEGRTVVFAKTEESLTMTVDEALDTHTEHSITIENFRNGTLGLTYEKENGNTECQPLREGETCEIRGTDRDETILSVHQSPIDARSFTADTEAYPFRTWIYPGSGNNYVYAQNRGVAIFADRTQGNSTYIFGDPRENLVNTDSQSIGLDGCQVNNPAGYWHYVRTATVSLGNGQNIVSFTHNPEAYRDSYNDYVGVEFFQPGRDLIDLRGYKNIKSFSDLQSQSTEYYGQIARFCLEGHTKFFLLTTTPVEMLSERDFTFYGSDAYTLLPPVPGHFLMTNADEKVHATQPGSSYNGAGGGE